MVNADITLLLLLATIMSETDEKSHRYVPLSTRLHDLSLQAEVDARTCNHMSG